MGRQVTITLDDEMAEKLDREAARRGRPAADFASQMIRHELERLDTFEITGPFARSRPGAGSFDCIARVLDELEGPEWK
ncbi:MAG TPA: ribbon-helix-helix domain-containing protein [Thermoanaerobaculia bacterium]|nr:ribbon-helix-helix domain-containing protein [Thermoanaerobaculia bacterium]